VIIVNHEPSDPPWERTWLIDSLIVNVKFYNESRAQNMNPPWVAECKELLHEHSQFLITWLSPFAELEA
jgi:hypothetical protein